MSENVEVGLLLLYSLNRVWFPSLCFKKQIRADPTFKKIQVIHKLKEKNHVIILIDMEEAFYKIRHPSG